MRRVGIIACLGLVVLTGGAIPTLAHTGGSTGLRGDIQAEDRLGSLGGVRHRYSARKLVAERKCRHVAG